MKCNVKLNASGVNAFGIYDTESGNVIIKSGSTIRNEITDSLRSNYLKRREALYEPTFL